VVIRNLFVMKLTLTDSKNDVKDSPEEIS